MAAHDPYTYPDSDVLINKRGHRSQKVLQNYEWTRTVRRALDLPVFPASAQGIQALHHHLFQDVYDWAGKYRAVNVSKGGDSFLHKDQIAEALASQFQRLRWQDDLKSISADRFARGAAEHIGAINQIHPFREGNGRVMKFHLERLAEQAGHTIDLTLIDAGPWNRGSQAALRNDERLLTHTIASMMVPQRTVSLEQAMQEIVGLRKAAVSEINDQIKDTQLSIQHGLGSTTTTRSLRVMRDELAVIEGTGRGSLQEVIGSVKENGTKSFAVLPGRDGSARDAIHAIARGAVRSLHLEADRRAAATRENIIEPTVVTRVPGTNSTSETKPSSSPGV